MGCLGRYSLVRICSIQVSTGEGVDVVESEEADAVGDLGTDAIEAGKCGHGFVRRQGCEGF